MVLAGLGVPIKRAPGVPARPFITPRISSSYRSLAMIAIIIITPILLLAAFILLLLVSLSVPIIKTIALLKLSATITEGISGLSFASADVTGSVQFGVWGYCISAINAE